MRKGFLFALEVVSVLGVQLVGTCPTIGARRRQQFHELAGLSTKIARITRVRDQPIRFYPPQNPVCSSRQDVATSPLAIWRKPSAASSNSGWIAE